MGVGKKNPDKEFGKHEDPAFQDYHAALGEQIKDPAFTKAAIAAEDAPPPAEEKEAAQGCEEKEARRQEETLAWQEGTGNSHRARDCEGREEEEGGHHQRYFEAERQANGV